MQDAEASMSTRPQFQVQSGRLIILLGCEPLSCLVLWCKDSKQSDSYNTLNVCGCWVSRTEISERFSKQAFRDQKEVAAIQIPAPSYHKELFFCFFLWVVGSEPGGPIAQAGLGLEFAM